MPDVEQTCQALLPMVSTGFTPPPRGCKVFDHVQLSPTSPPPSLLANHSLIFSPLTPISHLPASRGEKCKTKQNSLRVAQSSINSTNVHIFVVRITPAVESIRIYRLVCRKTRERDASVTRGWRPSRSLPSPSDEAVFRLSQQEDKIRKHTSETKQKTMN